MEENLMPNLLELIDDAKALNSKVFSLIRLELLANIAVFGKDGVSNRELTTTLNVSDGTLHANLKFLKEMGYIESEQVKIDDKELHIYKITSVGLEEFEKIKKWLIKFAGCENNGN
jgi:DNA-binding MarR family transcriptional regulator